MKYLSWFTSLAVLMVAAGAFVLAFFNVEGLAVDNGIPASRAWLVPVIVEGAMIALALTRLEAELNRQDTRLLTWLVAAAVALSIALNVAHSNMRLWGIVIAVIQPVSLLVAFESFMYQLRNRIARQQQPAANPWRERRDRAVRYVARVRQYVAELQEQNKQLQASNNNLQEQNRHLLDANKELETLRKRWQAVGNEAQTIIMYNAGEINEDQAVNQTGFDPRTVKSWAAKMNGVAK